MELINSIDEIRKLAIISLFSDDDLMDIFVLKGGNALNIIYDMNSRSSIDIDVSMEGDFVDDIEFVRDKLKRAFEVTFNDKGYTVFDFKLTPKPAKIRPEYKKFWGGYCLEFKVIELVKYEEMKSNIDKLRNYSIVIGERHKKNFKVDISKHEYCKSKEEVELDNFTIYVYTFLMLVCEKLRAICQQMEAYRKIIPVTRKGRAKDFYDIYIIDRESPINFSILENFETLKTCFIIKKVPIRFLKEIYKEREFHRDSFQSVIDSVYVSEGIRSYDFYFDYVVEKVNELNSFWKI